MVHVEIASMFFLVAGEAVIFDRRRCWKMWSHVIGQTSQDFPALDPWRAIKADGSPAVSKAGRRRPPRERENAAVSKADDGFASGVGSSKLWFGRCCMWWLHWRYQMLHTEKKKVSNSKTYELPVQTYDQFNYCSQGASRKAKRC